ncbi:aldo-keto reductase [Desarmillaria ectypa]|nr:aldo-keto reductase [Desarmillaria ectypa]
MGDSVFAKLHDGNGIPILGFGTYELDGADAYNTVTWVLENGYRHILRIIDSAEWYENETECGQAILDFCRKAQVPRSSVFFTTKLKMNRGCASMKKAIRRSLDACGLSYIDLYLIHSPLGGPQARKDSRRAICNAQKEGLLDEGLPVPTVHQIDLHPFQVRSNIVTFFRMHNIALEAWAPLFRGLRFSHPLIKYLARKYQKEAAQAPLLYSLQKGYVPLPKSPSKACILSNMDIFDFDLTDDEISSLDGLDEGLVTGWDPTTSP